MDLVLILLVIAFAPVPLSMLVEALRRSPDLPEKLYWSEDIDICYCEIRGQRIRYIKTGQGPDLVLLHTLRTQLDIFQKIIPDLSGTYTVYALDYPGHGYSDIPEVDYIPDLFVNTVETFIDQMKITGATLVGLSIGANIALLLAAKQNPRIKQVIAINPYDGDRGNTITRAGIEAAIMFNIAKIPVLGETFMRFRNSFVENRIMQGGVVSPAALPDDFLRLLHTVGLRKGHYRAFINLIRHFPAWEKSHNHYPQINIPVKLVYGEKDWSNQAERQRTRSEIKTASYVEVVNAGHFLSMDNPGAMIDCIISP